MYLEGGVSKTISQYRKWFYPRTWIQMMLIVSLMSRSGGWMATDPHSHFLGCFRDKLPASAMSISSFPSRIFSISQCLSYCVLQERTFAGLQNAGICHCSDTYGEYGISASCVKPCNADKQYVCGGVLASSIYSSCPKGSFGKNCVFQCHCKNNAICDLKTGRCPNGCASGWEGKHCYFSSSMNFRNIFSGNKKVASKEMAFAHSMGIEIGLGPDATSDKAQGREIDLGRGSTSVNSMRKDIRRGPEVTPSQPESTEIGVKQSSGTVNGTTVSLQQNLYESARASSETIVEPDVTLQPSINTKNTNASDPANENIYNPGMTFQEWKDKNYDQSVRPRIIGFSALAVNVVAIICLSLFVWERHSRRPVEKSTKQNGKVSKTGDVSGPKEMYVIHRAISEKAEV